MSNKRIGYPGTELTERSDSPVIQKSSSGVRVTHRYDVNLADKETATAGFDYGDQDDLYTGSLLRGIGMEKDGPINCIVSLTYEPNGWTDGTSIPASGTVEQFCDANPTSIPIGSHPNASGSNYDDKKNIGIDGWQGRTHFIQPEPIYGRREVLDAFVFSESNIIDSVGKLDQTPEGMTNPSRNRWLKNGFRVDQRGAKYQQEETWKYSTLGWLNNIDDGNDGIYTAFS